jgi:ABC-2 type transport system ATP-binding protein
MLRPYSVRSHLRETRRLMKALELEHVTKSYQVVRTLPGKGGGHPLGLRNLTRFFLGETFSVLGTRTVTTIPALDGVSFAVEPGQVVGLFGKNGSGKTTLLSILGGVFPQDSGTVRCFGHDLRTDLYEVRKYVVPIFGWLDAITWAFTGRQNIEKFLIMHHVDPTSVTDQVDELAREIGLGDRLDDRAARYSQGMRIQIQVIAAILLYRARGHSLLLLDEPFLGLDVFSQRYLRDFVRHRMRGDDFSMILATHQCRDIEEICDEVIVLDKGKIIARDSVDDMRQRVGKAETIQIEYVMPEGRPLPDRFFRREGVLEQRMHRHDGRTELSLLVEDSRATLAWLVGAMAQAGCHLTALHTRAMNLEDALVQLIERSHVIERSDMIEGVTQ